MCHKAFTFTYLNRELNNQLVGDAYQLSHATSESHTKYQYRSGGFFYRPYKIIRVPLQWVTPIPDNAFESLTSGYVLT
jgi:hypothetical protein